MKVKYITGSDKGLPNWRIRIEKGNNNIKIETENFEWGFRNGEDWDKVAKFGEDGRYENSASIITKDPTKLEGYKQILIEELHKIFELNMKSYRDEIERIEGYIKGYEMALKSDLFKEKIRDERLKDLGI